VVGCPTAITAITHGRVTSLENALTSPVDTETSTIHAAPNGSASHHKHLTAHSIWRGRFRTDIGVRQFTVVTGEPEKVGGDDSAPTPMELILAGLEGCLTVTIETVAAERGVTLRAVKIDSHAVMDVRGFQGVPGVRPYYQTVDTTVAADVDLEARDLPDFTSEVERRCPALSMIRAAGVTVDVRWEQAS
jgi:uncharacterized OsmC-like protein